jgi:diadenosine tetraphosphate (Ap4A) HIT family hydrolase
LPRFDSKDATACDHARVAETQIHRWVEAARAGANPAVIARVRSGWALVGEQQVVAGYCLLIPDPVVSDLNALEGRARRDFLEDWVELGDVLLQVTGAARINYEILGNVERALHAHLFPRYDAEPEATRRAPVWLHDWSQAPRFERAAQTGFIDRVANALASRERTIPAVAYSALNSRSEGNR